MRQEHRLHVSCALCRIYPAQHGEPLCAGCLQDLPWRGDLLHVQALPVQVAFEYAWPIDRLIHLYKYQEQLPWANVLASGLLRLERPDVDALIAVPLSASRLRQRGFNQSHELAKQLSRRWQIPLLCCVERRTSLQQQGLSRSERLLNLEGAFSLRAGTPPLPPRVALVDDVLTTGSTLLHLVELLHRHGVLETSALVVASPKRS